MAEKELFSILKRTLILLSISFALFLIFVNSFKLVDFIVKIDYVLSNFQKDMDIPAIRNDFTIIKADEKRFDINTAYTAKSLGYIDKLPLVDGSEWGEGINILIVGSDKKNFQNTKSRSDVIILLRIIKTGKILSISIPRDSLIKVRDGEWSGNYDKIGHSLYWGGLDNLKKNVEELVASPISKVVIIDNFRSFEAFLAIMGGIRTDKDLQGELGIKWIRNRQFKLGDIERCKRQQYFLEKASEKIWQITKGGNYFYSLLMYDALKRIVSTDLTKEEFLNILYTLKVNNFNPKIDFYNSVLPGTFSTYDSKLLLKNNLACWIPDESAVDKFRFLFYSKNNQFTLLSQKKMEFWTFFEIDFKNFMKNFKSTLNKKKKDKKEYVKNL